MSETRLPQNILTEASSPREILKPISNAPHAPTSPSATVPPPASKGKSKAIPASPTLKVPCPRVIIAAYTPHDHETLAALEALPLRHRLKGLNRPASQRVDVQTRLPVRLRKVAHQEFLAQKKAQEEAQRRAQEEEKEAHEKRIREAEFKRARREARSKRLNAAPTRTSSRIKTRVSNGPSSGTGVEPDIHIETVPTVQEGGAATEENSLPQDSVVVEAKVVEEVLAINPQGRLLIIIPKRKRDALEVEERRSRRLTLAAATTAAFEEGGPPAAKKARRR
ncbi:hypothetical protein H0H81_012307 [Sphagnurus paluster]|uniref:Uncharacterized protein n=1 Tax=Sphagnurus paluster TaxID=117069 RepID=A0A9P7G100_9AGAR|nr:hypothetical protein H0H81_012307 [Sphagnurus paluster]